MGGSIILKRNNMDRIQRKRTKGFKLPPNTVCVNRGTRFGNPFPVGGIFTREEAIRLFRLCLNCPSYVYALFEKDRCKEMEIYFRDMREHLKDLKGVDYIACFCKEGELCHGDVIIEEAERINKD